MKINKPNKRILILCEGFTEELYAKSLKSELPRNLQRSITIDIDRNSKNDPKSLAEEARRRKRYAKRDRNAYDSIWLFFDNDNKVQQLKSAFKIIDEEGFSFAYSSMCIEHWFILHFENCGRSFQDGTEALRFLKTKWPEYHKTKLKHYEILKDELDTAIDRAKTLRRNVQTNLPKHQRNPYFTIDKLIDFFEEFKK